MSQYGKRMISFPIHTILTSPHIKEPKTPLIRLLCLLQNSSCCRSCSSCFTRIVTCYYRLCVPGVAVFITTGNAPCAAQWQRQATELALLRSSFTSSWDSCSIPRHSAFRSCNSWSWERKESTTWNQWKKRQNKTQPTPTETCTDWCNTVRFFQACGTCWHLERTPVSGAPAPVVVGKHDVQTKTRKRKPYDKIQRKTENLCKYSNCWCKRSKKENFLKI